MLHGNLDIDWLPYKVLVKPVKSLIDSEGNHHVYPRKLRDGGLERPLYKASNDRPNETLSHLTSKRTRALKEVSASTGSISITRKEEEKGSHYYLLCKAHLGPSLNPPVVGR